LAKQPDGQKVVAAIEVRRVARGYIARPARDWEEMRGGYISDTMAFSTLDELMVWLRGELSE
jgi:hypothetical protein